jgi:hypothetical protein
MRNHCTHCPARVLDLPCRGRDSSILGYAVPRYCELAHARPEVWGPELVRQALADAGRPPPVPAPQPPVPSPPPAPALTDAQRLEVLGCPSRREVPAACCAGTVSVCGMGYWDGSPIQTVHCVRCRLAGWPQA